MVRVRFLHGPKDGLRVDYTDNPPSIIAFVHDSEWLIIYAFQEACKFHKWTYMLKYKFQYYRRQRPCEN